MVKSKANTAVEIKPEAREIQEVAASEGSIQRQFSKLTEIANACTMCNLCLNRTHAVFGSGNIRAKLMLIGEGPGITEDKTGLPFVGAAGRQLDRVLENVGIDRERDLYITNMVKCHHRGQRPTMQQMKACSPYLQSQIQKIRPRILILTGVSALKGLLGISDRITDIHGQILKTTYPKTKAVAVFHPSFLIYREGLNESSPLWQAWQADWVKIKKEADRLASQVSN